MSNITIPNCDAARLLMLRNELTKVRCWLTGFQAAGKNGPPGEDSLRQVICLFDEASAKAK